MSLMLAKTISLTGKTSDVHDLSRFTATHAVLIAMHGHPARSFSLHEHRISELLGHGAHHPDQGTQPEAKNTAGSKLWVWRHDISPCQRSRRGAWWRHAYKMYEGRSDHARTLLAACQHGADVIWTAVALRCPCSSSWHPPR